MSAPGYHGPIPGDEEFQSLRRMWRDSFHHDANLRALALEVWEAASAHRYGYQWEWNGVPLIRWPDDVVLLQELVWHYKPALMIETGVARGGSVVMAASLMAGAGLRPEVLGIDIAILPHAVEAIDQSPWKNSIELLQSDSSSLATFNLVRSRVSALHPGQTVILTLDSDHTESHVFAELSLLAPLLPRGSVVLVADTVIEDLPPHLLVDRPWGPGNSPLSALRRFLATSPDYEIAVEWSRRSLLGEFRDGVIIRR